MSLQDKITTILDNPTEEISIEWIEDMGKQYPYFTLPSALMLARNGQSLTPEQKKEIMARIALNAGDRNTLFRLTDANAEKWEHFYPKEIKQTTMSTNDTIDTFLNTYGKPDPKEEEILTRLIFNPTPDYAQLLAEEEERSMPDLSKPSDNSQDALINAFIIKSKENQGHFPSSTEETEVEQPILVDNSPVNTPDTSDDSLLSESLAKIYIKQRRYSKAYEIIHNLSLNFPEKSIYFADQLRFLQKLIIITQKNN